MPFSYISNFFINLLMVNKDKFEDDESLKKKRMEMVENQIISRGINNSKIITAMLNVPRHLFAPEEYISVSYDDHPIQIQEGQTISQPYIVALMTDLLDIKGGGKVLEIGTGSGYQTAILVDMGCEVYTIEILKDNFTRVKKLLTDLNYKNIMFKCGDGFYGWEEHSPFDRIIVTASAKKIPDPLLNQLNVDGLMVIPIGTEDQVLTVIYKGKEETRKQVIPVKFVQMTGAIQ